MEDVLSRREDMLNNSASQLIGLKFSEVRDRLSYWWVLEHQNVKPWGSRYTYSRKGVGKLTLHTDAKNVVTETPTRACVLLQKPVQVQY